MNASEYMRIVLLVSISGMSFLGAIAVMEFEITLQTIRVLLMLAFAITFFIYCYFSDVLDTQEMLVRDVK